MSVKWEDGKPLTPLTAGPETLTASILLIFLGHFLERKKVRLVPHAVEWVRKPGSCMLVPCRESQKCFKQVPMSSFGSKFVRRVE
jgi:hypothetical protein